MNQKRVFSADHLSWLITLRYNLYCLSTSLRLAVTCKPLHTSAPWLCSARPAQVCLHSHRTYFNIPTSNPTTAFLPPREFPALDADEAPLDHGHQSKSLSLSLPPSLSLSLPPSFSLSLSFCHNHVKSLAVKLYGASRNRFHSLPSIPLTASALQLWKRSDWAGFFVSTGTLNHLKPFQDEKERPKASVAQLHSI